MISDNIGFKLALFHIRHSESMHENMEEEPNTSIYVYLNLYILVPKVQQNEMSGSDELGKPAPEMKRHLKQSHCIIHPWKGDQAFMRIRRIQKGNRKIVLWFVSRTVGMFVHWRFLFVSILMNALNIFLSSSLFFHHENRGKRGTEKLSPSLYRLGF